ncbi:hypothetical protein ACT9XH_03090 [Methanococcoides methylutens]|uniref:hypothetical protein n=1 Tax=Methanococcoides methylutens TaxID=2226 RepID=UPI004043EF65
MGFALEALEMLLKALGYEVIEKVPVIGYFDRGAVSKDDEVLKKAFETGKKLIENLR